MRYTIHFTIRLIILITTLTAFTNCRDKYEDCTEQDYANCNPVKPDSGFFVLELTHNEQYPETVVRVFSGNFEDGDLIYQDTLFTDSWDYYLPVERRYSFTATYKRGTDEIVAIDGSYINVIEYVTCEENCYDMNEPVIDLRIE